MRNVFIDLGCCDGDTIRVFKFGTSTPETRKGNNFVSRGNCFEYEVFGFDGHDYGEKWADLRKEGYHIEAKAAWTFDGTVKWRKCLSKYCRSVEDFKWSGNEKGAVIEVPCFDFADWLGKNFSREDNVILKMDIEGSEIVLLPLLAQRDLFPIVKELYIEYHDNVFPEQKNDADLWRKHLPTVIPVVVEWKP